MTRYTAYVKVAVSIPDDLYEEADRVAVGRGMNRSALYSRALRLLLAEEEGEALTKMIDATCDGQDREDLAGVTRADLIDTESWEW